MQVRAKERGYYGCLREEGDVFPLNSKDDFSDVWMEKVAKAPPRRRVAPNDSGAPSSEAPPEVDEVS